MDKLNNEDENSQNTPDSCPFFIWDEMERACNTGKKFNRPIHYPYITGLFPQPSVATYAVLMT